MSTGTDIDYKSVKIGGAEYKFIPLAPDKAIDFCLDSIVALTPVLSNVEIGEGGIGDFVMSIIPNIGLIDPEKLKKMNRVVREQMVLPDGRLALDEASFHEWFRRNPNHLLEAHFRGLYLLMYDFFPAGLGTIIDGLS